MVFLSFFSYCYGISSIGSILQWDFFHFSHAAMGFLTFFPCCYGISYIFSTQLWNPFSFSHAAMGFLPFFHAAVGFLPFFPCCYGMPSIFPTLLWDIFLCYITCLPFFPQCLPLSPNPFSDRQKNKDIFGCCCVDLLHHEFWWVGVQESRKIRVDINRLCFISHSIYRVAVIP